MGGQILREQLPGGIWDARLAVATPLHLVEESKIPTSMLRFSTMIGRKRLEDLRLLLRFQVKRVGPKILEKLQILDVQGMIFGRGTYTVGEAKRLRSLLAWRTTPSP